MPGPEALYNRYKINTDGLCGNMYVSVWYFFSYILEDTWSNAICGFWGFLKLKSFGDILIPPLPLDLVYQC